MQERLILSLHHADKSYEIKQVIQLQGHFPGRERDEHEVKGYYAASRSIRTICLTMLILHLGGYDLKGLYSLEEYYAKNLLGYYRAISIGPSHNYYFGRAESDITPWVEYFTAGMAFALEKVVDQMIASNEKGEKDHSQLLRTLNPKQRKALELFKGYDVVTAKQIGDLFGFQPRTNAALCKKWVEGGFLQIVDASNKGRKYKLAAPYDIIVKEGL
jgi:Fic family protein